MKINDIDIEEQVAKMKAVLAEDKSMSEATRMMVEMMLMIITLLCARLGINSRNSSKPPSSDPNREKKPTKGQSGNKPGGQPGHKGETLTQVEQPDEVRVIELDQSTLPPGKYESAGFEKRQVVDIKISRNIIEYQAQILVDENGKKFVAPFPNGVNKAIQYGNELKALSVYLSQYQLLPYNRIQELFEQQFGLNLSTGSMVNFNQEAYKNLEPFESQVKAGLLNSPVVHADETGINIDGKRKWLHCTSNGSWTYFMPHDKRGGEAIDDMGVLPNYSGSLCHDHWKPYYKYTDAEHVLCNAHHLRELEFAATKDGQQWAKQMQEFLIETNKEVTEAGGELEGDKLAQKKQQYNDILNAGDKECPPPPEEKQKGKRGKVARSKSRNLLERLRDYEDDTLRFMTRKEVPFTNNQGENDLRMTKVQQKISGCFRSMEGAAVFSRIRSYLSTCRKQNIQAGDAMLKVFDHQLPDFQSQI